MIAGDETMRACELCGRALSVAAGEPGVCSDCAVGLDDLASIFHPRPEPEECSHAELLRISASWWACKACDVEMRMTARVPGSGSSGTGGRGR